MAGQDLQSFVQQLESAGELQRIRVEVDPILEITEITDRVTKAGGPALLFENVRGSRIPLLINTYGTQRRMCMALAAKNFDEVANRVRNVIKPEVPTTLMEKLRKVPELMQLGSLPPKIVRRGICQEVVHTDDANLLTLPIIKCWPHDGQPKDFDLAAEPIPTEGSEPGRYITLGSIFTKNPETGDRNIGMYRVQVFGPKLAAMHWHMHHDGARHFRLYQQRGERMPVAIALGGPAITPYAATCPLPPGIDEALFAGFLQGRALELVNCVSCPEIQVPATAEIVIEGYIDPHESPILEGPFGDHTGFYSLADNYYPFHVTAITQRRNPIYPTTIVGKPPQEDFWLGKATERIFLPLLQMLVPDIIDYNLPMFGCFHNCVFVKIKKEYPMQARRVMSAIWGAGQMAFTKIIVVVDEHVDVHDEDAVWFQVCSNVDPKRDTMFVDGPVDILDHASPEHGVGSKLGIDATRKIAGEGQIRDWPIELEMSATIKQRVTQRWAEYGLPPIAG
jgi:4-hydroxy-3-polyprenylbenzoate decarboxylase